MTSKATSKSSAPKTHSTGSGHSTLREESSGSDSKRLKTMAELLASYKTPFVSLHKGDIIKGMVTKLTPSEILININAKTEAVVLEKDKNILRSLLAALKVGDQVSVSVLDPESDKGNPVVSLRRFVDDLSWKKLSEFKENKKDIEALVTEVTKGGFLVQIEGGLSAFLPNSHILSSQTLEVGKKTKVFVLELNRGERKIIVSQKPVVGVEEFEQLVKGLKPEQKIDTIVSNITPFGIFVSIQNQGKAVDGLIHISEISWEKVENLSELFNVGQKIEGTIIGFDKDAKRVDLSIKRLSADPFDEIAKKYAADQKISGKVSQVLSNGLVLKLEDGVEGFIRKEKIPPTVSYEIGDEVKATVSQVDKKKHRLILVPILLEKPIGYR